MNRGRRVLIVDDEAKIADLLQEYLESSGYEVDSATNGTKALRLIDSQGYDAVVTDLWMQGVSGLDIVRALAEAQPECEAIVVSAYATEAMREKMTALGAYALMDKPLRLQDFGHTVDAACVSGRSERLAATELPEPADASLARVLLVGGPPEERDTLARHLVERGFAVDSAEGGDDAVEMAAGADYGLVVLWLEGVGIGAPRAISQIDSTSPDTTIVALTSSPEGPAARDALGSGAAAALQADLTPAELLVQTTRFSMLSQAKRRSSERRQALRASANGSSERISGRYRALRKSLGRRAAVVIAAVALLAVILGVLAGPLGSLVARAAQDTSERMDRLDSALEKVDRVDGYLRRDERRELQGR